MVVKVLGPLDTGTEPLSPRERTMLSALVVRAGTTVASAELADAWWGDAPPRTWEQQVRNSIARIRSRLGRGAVETVGVEYRLGLNPDAVDAVRFERLVSSARSLRLRGEHDRAVDAYSRALALWRGAPLQDVADWEPGVVEALRLTEIRASAEEELLDARLDTGEHRSLIADAERLLREEPLREDRWSILALANYRADRQAEALALLRAARDRLADELGIEPGPRLAGLELAMLRRDPELDIPAPASAATTCPYPGLRAFGPDDAEVFFGREADTEAVLERVMPGAVVAIAGASGTGKSSLLLAGVVPRLYARGRTVEIVRPGSGGVAAVERAVERAGVLAIDQAEELLEAKHDDIDRFGAVARAFLDGGGTILLTIRSDALDRIRTLPRIGDDVGRGVYLLGPLTDAAYRAAIEEPARTAGLRVESGLVELAVRDSGDRSSTLPHLSHAMHETWVRREGATLTVDGYRLSGGIAGAIAQSAEDSFRALSPDDQAVCRALMLRLIDRGSDGTTTRRHVTTEPLLADPARRHVLDRLTRARIVTVDGDTVTVTHEAVASAWPRLDGWLEEDAEGARTLRAVESAASSWNAGGRSDDDLIRGARLHSALAWREASHPDLTPVEDELLTASAEREESEVRELQARAARDTRRSRVLSASLGGAAVLLVAALVAGGLAAVRGQEAAAAAENVRVEALVATSLAVRTNDRELSALLAAEAYRRWPDDARVRSALLGVITGSSGLLETHRVDDAWRTSMEMIPGTGTALLAREGDDGPALEIVDVSSGDVVRALDVELPEIGTSHRSVHVSRDGRVAVIQTARVVDPADPHSCCWNDLRFVDLDEGDLLGGSQLLEMRTSELIELGADGSVAYISHPLTAAVIAIDTRTGIVRTSSPEPFDDYTGQQGLYGSIALVGEDLVATGTNDRIDLYDRRTLAPISSIPLDLDLASLVILPAGRDAVYTTGQAGVGKVSLESGTVEWSRRTRPAETCWGLLETPRDTLACSANGQIVELESASGARTGRRLATQLDWVARLGVIDDSTLVASVGINALWMRWRLDGAGAGVTTLAADHHILSGPTRDGRLLTVMPIGGGRMQVWDITEDRPTGVEADAITLLDDDVIEYWNEGAGYGLQNLTTGERYPYDVPGLPQEFLLVDRGWGPHAFISFDHQVIAVDPHTGSSAGKPLRVADSTFDGILSVTETLDGETVAVTWYNQARDNTETGIFRLDTGELLARGLPNVDQTLLTTTGQLISVADDRTERVDAGTLQPVSSLPRTTGASRAVVESLDGRTLLNLGWNNRVTLFDLTRDIQLGDPIDAETYEGYRGAFLAPDGSAVYANTPDGIQVWDLRPAEQARSACLLAGREFSAEEWKTYFPGEPQQQTCATLAA